MSEDTTTTDDPTRWTLDEPAPGPAVFPDPVDKPRKTGLATHTGTDPRGRAIGPAEDHTKVKRAPGDPR